MNKEFIRHKVCYWLTRRMVMSSVAYKEWQMTNQHGFNGSYYVLIPWVSAQTEAQEAMLEEKM